jgi:hypothetical protein
MPRKITKSSNKARKRTWHFPVPSVSHGSNKLWGLTLIDQISSFSYTSTSAANTWEWSISDCFITSFICSPDRGWVLKAKLR